MRYLIYILGKNPLLNAQLAQFIGSHETILCSCVCFEDTDAFLAQLRLRKPQLAFCCCDDGPLPEWERFDGAPRLGLFSAAPAPAIAQEAVARQAVALLCAPFEEKTIHKALEHFAWELYPVTQQEAVCRLAEVQERFSELVDMLPRNMIYRMSTFSHAEPEILRARWEFMKTGYSIDQFCHAIILLKWESNAYQAGPWLNSFFTVRDTIRTTLKKRQSGLLFNGSNENYLGILFCVPDGCTLTRETMAATLGSIVAALRGIVGLRLVIGVGCIHRQILEMPLSYKEAGRALSSHDQFTESDIIFFEDLPLPSFFSELGHKKIIQFSELLEMGQFSEARNQIEQLFSDLDDSGCAVETARENSLDMLSVIRANAVVNGLERSSVQEYMRAIETEASITRMKAALSSALEEYRHQLETSREQSALSIVERAKRLIQKDYGSALSLESVASSLYVNPSYLSQLFHRETGQKFIAYLTELRMEKAKELMADPKLKIYEIGEMVGYPNKRYFSKLFEKYTGMTPKAYRSYISLHDAAH